MPGNRADRRRLVAVWGSAAVAAGVLVLAVNGTLSDWTQAIIGNSHDTGQFPIDRKPERRFALF